MRLLKKKIVRSILLTLSLSVSAIAWDSPLTMPPGGVGKTADRNTVDVEAHRLELQRLQIEKDKLQLDTWKSHASQELEIQKAHDERVKTFCTALSIVVTFLAGVGTLLFGIISQRNEAKLQFEMKAAEIVMDSKGPKAARTRARILHKLFPTRLPDDLSVAIDLKQYPTSTVESRKELLKLLADKSTAAEIVKYWLKIFPGDEWAKDLIDERKEQP